MKRNEYELCYKIFKNKIKRTLLQEIVKFVTNRPLPMETLLYQ